MKTALLFAAILCLRSSQLFAEPTLKEVVDRHIAGLARIKPAAVSEAVKPANADMLLGSPEFAGMIERIFLRYPVTRIAVSSLGEKGEKISLNIYIKGDEVYVIQADGGWNFAANSTGAFEWEKGKKNGIKIKRNNEDLFAYVAFLTDPGGILFAMYAGYLRAPDTFVVVSNREKGWIELRLKRPPNGCDSTIYVTEKPLWFHGGKANDATGEGSEWMVSEPEEMQTLPEELAQQLGEISFEDSSLSLKRHFMPQ